VTPGRGAATSKGTAPGGQGGGQQMSGSAAAVVLALDVSAPMHGARLEAIQTAAQAFVAGLDASVAVGLVTFGTTTVVVQPLTADHALVEAALDAKIQVVYDEPHVTQEETPATAESFIKQRTRWNQGFYAIVVKGDWLKLPLVKQKLTALYILLNSLLQAGIVLYAPVGLYVALTQRIAVPIALLSYLPIFMLLLQAVVNLIGLREFAAAYQLKLPFGFSLKTALVYYPYQLMLALAAFRAVGRFLTRKTTWEKTAHANLHRQPLPHSPVNTAV
jgi:hypothetical protein